jgi:hypothetical protein
MNDVGKNLRPDRMFCGLENFGKEKMEKEMDLADDVCESVEGWGRWAEPSSGSELKEEHSQSEIGGNRSSGSRGKQPTMTSNHLLPCTFVDDRAKMPGAENADYFEATMESLGLGEGEEFILIKVSKDKRKCWATFLSDDPEAPYVDSFPIGTSIEKMLQNRNLEKERREDIEKHWRADEFFGRCASEPEEKASTGLRRAFKSRPGSPKSNKVTGKPPAEPKEDEQECTWESVRERAHASQTIGGGAYHWSQEFRDELKAEGDSWEEKRIASERSTRDAEMAGGASLTSKESLICQYNVPR